MRTWFAAALPSVIGEPDSDLSTCGDGDPSLGLFRALR